MTTAQVVETSVTITNSSFQNYTHPDDHTRQTTDTPGLKPFTMLVVINKRFLMSFLCLFHQRRGHAFVNSYLGIGCKPSIQNPSLQGLLVENIEPAGYEMHPEYLVWASAIRWYPIFSIKRRAPIKRQPRLNAGSKKLLFK